jgi:hypothetical protein
MDVPPDDARVTQQRGSAPRGAAGAAGHASPELPHTVTSAVLPAPRSSCRSTRSVLKSYASVDRLSSACGNAAVEGSNAGMFLAAQWAHAGSFVVGTRDLLKVGRQLPVR